MAARDLVTPPEWREHVAGWLVLWGVPHLEQRLTISISTRLQTSLARCLLDRSEIRIAAFVADAPRSLLREVLCHETAHAAVRELYGRWVKPHGGEWRELMHAAGFAPHVRLPNPRTVTITGHSRRRVLWEHRCPVCQVHRLAGRPVYQWRCADCREAGLSGELIVQRAITRLGSAS